MSIFLQYLFSGLTVGSIYALSALGFTIVYNARGVVNFAQGDFLMLGGMVTATLVPLGWPLPSAIGVAILVTVVCAMLLQRFAIAPARQADPVSLIIITIGASIFIQGVVQNVMGKNQHIVPSFSGDVPIRVFGASLLPQSLWSIGGAAVLVAGVTWFFRGSLIGKGMQAMAINPTAARLMGIKTGSMMLLAFSLSAFLGAVAGALAAPITTTVYDIGLTLGLKGFVGATLGGLGSGLGAVVGGLLLGIMEAMIAGYVSPAYKDAVPFVLVILILLLVPQGLFGSRVRDRV
jgi:branched-subunit amino acid ABC-type transport system permease component